MSRRKANTSDLPEDLALLDDLIKECYRELFKNIKENAKLGDFLKMIELRRKLAPAESDQKKFWNMLDKIRRDTLSSDGKRTSGKPGKSRGRS